MYFATAVVCIGLDYSSDPQHQLSLFKALGDSFLGATKD